MLQWKKKQTEVQQILRHCWMKEQQCILAERLFNKKIYLKRSEVSLRQDK